jgi:hypothetical protein
MGAERATREHAVRTPLRAVTSASPWALAGSQTADRLPSRLSGSGRRSARFRDEWFVCSLGDDGAEWRGARGQRRRR